MNRATLYLHQQAPRKPDLPPLAPVWNASRRIARMGERNPNYRKGRYTRVRHKIEMRVRGACLMLEGLPFERVVGLGLPGAGAGLLRAYGQVNQEGPLSGWAIPHKARKGADPSKHTQYIVTRRGHAHARRWLYWVGVLQRLVRRAKAMISRVIPPYPTERRETSGNKEATHLSKGKPTFLTPLLTPLDSWEAWQRSLGR